MIDILRKMFRHHFSDPQIIILGLLLLLGFGVVFALLLALMAVLMIIGRLDGTGAPKLKARKSDPEQELVTIMPGEGDPTKDAVAKPAAPAAPKPALAAATARPATPAAPRPEPVSARPEPKPAAEAPRETSSDAAPKPDAPRIVSIGPGGAARRP